jgi:hypothetical protein
MDRPTPKEPPVTPLAKKLQVKPGHRLALMNAPAGYQERLEPLPDGAELAAAGETGLDYVQLFVRDGAELERLAADAVAAVKPDGLLWICYPKGGAKAGTDLHRDILWQRMGERGMAGVSLVAVDDTWSAMRFRPADRVGR